MARAQVLSYRKDFDAALVLADEAVAIIGVTDYLNWQGEAHEVRGVICWPPIGFPRREKRSPRRSRDTSAKEPFLGPCGCVGASTR